MASFLAAPRVSARVFIASSEITDALVDGAWTTSLNSRPSAWFVLDMTRLAIPTIDLASEVTIRAWRSNEVQFTGEVTSAVRTGGLVRCEAEGGLALADHKVGRLVTFNLGVYETIDMLARGSGPGTQSSNVIFEGFSPPPSEYFEIVTPVENLTVARRIQIGSAVVLPADLVAGMVESTSAPSRDGTRNSEQDPDAEGFVAQFLDHEAFILVGVTAPLALDAETRGLEVIREVLAWICVDFRNTVLPDSLNASGGYKRFNSRAVPILPRMTYVRGAASGRGWIRDLDAPRSGAGLMIDDFPRTLKDDLYETPNDIRESVMALYRAIAEYRNPLSQNLALWESIEFYSGSDVAADGTAKLFGHSQLRAIGRAIRRNLTLNPLQEKRISQMIGQLNAPPLLANFRSRLLRDGVPFTNQEFDAIKRLRDIRNDAVHGRTESLPEYADVRTAIHLMARALVIAQNGRS